MNKYYHSNLDGFKSIKPSKFLAIVFFSLIVNSIFAQVKPLTINWKTPTFTSNTTPTLQVVVNPMLKRGASIHQSSFQALKDMEADYVRFVPWFPYPKAAVVELKEPTKTETFWDFQYADPIVEDFMSATKGHPVVMNFSTIPVWMFKNPKPVIYPEDPDLPFWEYNQGKELRDPTFKEVANYFARLFSWYTKGGFTDELGKFHASKYHYKFDYWEVLNEPDLEHKISPELYTKIYDAVVLELKKIAPETKFIGISVALETNPQWFEHFLNPANHKSGVPLDGISYHFYGRPASKNQIIDSYQYSFFDQANGFLDRVRYIENIRKRLAPKTITHINEIGNILENRDFKGVIPEDYWNLSGAMFAYIFVELSKIGIEIAGESQLVGYPTQFPDVSMMNWKNGKPNARYWALKLLKENFGAGDKLYTANSNNPEIIAQAYITKAGKRILLINKTNKEMTLPLTELNGAKFETVDVTTGDNPIAKGEIKGDSFVVKPFAVTVIKL